VTPGWLRPAEYAAVGAAASAVAASFVLSRRRHDHHTLRRLARHAAELVTWIVVARLIEWSVRHGRVLQRDAPEIFLGAAPLVGRNFRDGWDWRFGWSLVPAGALAVAVATAVWRDWWQRWSDRIVLATASLGAATFGVLLALLDGSDGLTYGAGHETEYLANLSIAPGGREFLRTFVERIDDYTVHQRGHPPGFVLLLKWFDAVGLDGVWPVVGLTIASTAVSVAAVLVTVRHVAGGDWMRRAAPTLMVAPWLIWMLTSADAVFTAVAAVGVAAMAIALESESRRATWAAIAGGGAFGSLMFLTYGAVTLSIVPAAVIAGFVWRADRNGRVAAARRVGLAFAAVLVVVTAFATAGFWWLDGARATKREYWDGSAQFRTFDYFGRANLAVALIALGPLTLAGLFRLRSGPMWWLVGGGLAALLVSHLSQYTRGEVERIWLLFFAWIGVAGAGLLDTRHRSWAAAVVLTQAGLAIGLQAALVSKW
jgi:hypothetical protein